MDHELILLCSFAVTVGEGRRTRLLLEIVGKVEVRASNAPVREMQRHLSTRIRIFKPCLTRTITRSSSEPCGK